MIADVEVPWAVLGRRLGRHPTTIMLKSAPAAAARSTGPQPRIGALGSVAAGHVVAAGGAWAVA
ncbi:MAG: hypothetical protein V9E89_10770 [Ilumatobacteraceae bacterium]